MPPKRERVARYKALGAWVRGLRGSRAISEVLRQVNKSDGPKLDAATLRGWEYGWIGRPDPVRLTALMKVYGVPEDEALAELVRLQSSTHGEPPAIGGSEQRAQVAAMAGRLVALDDDEEWLLQGWRALPVEARDTARRVIEAVLRPPQKAARRKAAS